MHRVQRKCVIPHLTMKNRTDLRHIDKTWVVVTALCNQPKAFASDLSDDQSRYLYYLLRNTSALVPRASNKLGECVIEWTIFLHGLAQHEGHKRNELWHKGSLGNEDDARRSNTRTAQTKRGYHTRWWKISIATYYCVVITLTSGSSYWQKT